MAGKKYNMRFSGIQLENAVDAVVNAIEEQVGPGASQVPQTGRLKALLAADSATFESGHILDVGPDGKIGSIALDDTPQEGSSSPVKSDGIRRALDAKADADDVYNKAEIQKILDGIHAQMAQKADRGTTLEDYGITDAYTKNQTDAAVNNCVPRSKSLSKYIAKYTITEEQIDIGLQDKDTDEGEKCLSITPHSVSFGEKELATVDQIPDISTKADHTRVEESQTNASITFTLD